MKTVAPGGMKTDFFTRSFDAGRPPAYDALVDKVMSTVTDPRQMETYSTPEAIAEVVYEAATDGKDQIRYVAGAAVEATTPRACNWARSRSARRCGSDSSEPRRREHDDRAHQTKSPIATG